MTKLLFLGTGAADWPEKPAANVSEHRFLSSLLVNSGTLIDPGPCIFDFERLYGYSGLFADVKDILVTHSHSDHFNVGTLTRLVAQNGALTVYGDAGIAGLIPDIAGLRFVPVKQFVQYETRELFFTPVPANHGVSETDEQPIHYIVASKLDGKRFFYGLDGAWLFNSTSHELRKNCFDALIFDCTTGDIDGDFRIFEHNTIKMVEEMLRTIRASFPDMLRPGARVLVSHMARTLHTSHSELLLRLAPSGIVPAKDGLTLIL